MQKTAVVITEYIGEQVVVLTNVTTLDVINNGTASVSVNGVNIPVNERTTIIVADGSVSDFKLISKYSYSSTGNRFTIIYKKLKL